MKKRISYIKLVPLIFFSFSLFGQSSINIKKPKFERVCQALGYLVGQEYSITYLKNKFPQLRYNLLKPEMNFNSTFGKSKSNITDYLLNYLEEDKINDFNNKVITEIQNKVPMEDYSEEFAINFIEELEKRANGNIPSPILETLLSFQYKDRPEQEFFTGFTYTYRTKGHLKSKKTDWQIRVPKSWRAKEAERPNIIQTFVNDYGDGINNIMLMVMDIPVAKGTKFSNKDKNELFSKNGIKIMIPQDARFVSFSKMNIENNIGGMLEIEQTSTRLDSKIKLRMVQFMFIRGLKMYMLSGSVSTSNIDDDLGVEMEKYLPLYKLVANSILLNEQYR